MLLSSWEDVGFYVCLNTPLRAQWVRKEYRHKPHLKCQFSYLQALFSASVQWFHFPDDLKSTTSLKCVCQQLFLHFLLRHKCLVSCVACARMHTHAHTHNISLFLFVLTHAWTLSFSPQPYFEAAEPVTLFISKPRWHHSRTVAYQSTRNRFLVCITCLHYSDSWTEASGF